MKRNNVLAALLIVIFTLCTIAGGAMADEDKPKDARREYPGPRLVKQLGLSPDQVNQIKAATASNQGKLKGLREQENTQREAVNSAMKNSASEGDVRSLYAPLTKTRQEMANMSFDQLMAVYKVLTPEQRKKFKGLRGRRGGPRPKPKPKS